MVLRLDRSRTAGPLLEWKVRIFVVAGGLGLAGMYLEERWLTGAAIALLLGGVFLRLSPKRSRRDEEGAVGDGASRDGGTDGDAEPDVP